MLGRPELFPRGAVVPGRLSGVATARRPAQRAYVREPYRMGARDEPEEKMRRDQRFRAALSLERWGLQRMEDVLLAAPGRRRLRIHGSKVDPERAYAYANGTTFAAVDGASFVRRTFGYDLANPPATPRHEGYWFSVGLDAQDRLPPAGLVPEWPSIPVPPPARTAYRVNCVACAEQHCLQKPRRGSGGNGRKI